MAIDSVENARRCLQMVEEPLHGSKRLGFGQTIGCNDISNRLAIDLNVWKFTSDRSGDVTRSLLWLLRV